MTARRTLSLSLALLGALLLASSAFAHAHVSPPVALAHASTVFTLAVPTEKEGSFTTAVEFTPPSGFAIDSFLPSPGWKRQVTQTGSDEDAVITKVTWSGGKVPTGEDAAFSFLASTDASKTYTFGVRQTYSDNSVVDWSGPKSSDTPSPTIRATSSIGGGGGSSSTLAVVALVVAAVALVLAGVGLLSGGRRPLA